MKKSLKIRNGETLHDWTVRLALECEGMTAKALQEVLHEVSVTSYIHGSNDCQSAICNTTTIKKR